MIDNSEEQTKTAPRRNIHPSSMRRSDADHDGVLTDLDELYRYAEDKAIEAIEWYITHKKPKARWSQVLRFSAVVLVTIGGIAPILSGFGAPWCNGESCSQSGYIALALAGACVIMDRFFGLSSAWMRYMTTQMRLQRDLAEFQMDWVMLLQKAGSGQSTVNHQYEMLKRLKSFRLRIITGMEQEMQSWVMEFKANLTQLEEAARLRLETKRLETRSGESSSLPVHDTDRAAKADKSDDA